MRRPDFESASVRLWLVLAVAGALLLSSCSGQKGLSRDEIDQHSLEYFQRGTEQYQRDELRAALDSLRLALAYDIQGANPAIPEMIDKVEDRLRTASRGTSTAGSQASAPSPHRELAPPQHPPR